MSDVKAGDRQVLTSAAMNRIRVRAVRDRQNVAINRLGDALSKLPAWLLPGGRSRFYLNGLPRHEILEMAASTLEQIATSAGTSQVGK